MNINRRTFALSTIATLVGCGGGDPLPMSSAEAAPTTQGRILKRVADVAGVDSETGMVVFNGKPLCITFKRPITGFAADTLEVRQWDTGQLLASHPWTGGMGCAIVHNNEIHIFGNTNWQQPGNKIIHAVLGQNFAPIAQPDALLMNAPLSPFKFYNTDICKDANGYRMVVETNAGIYFARSVDMSNWTFYGGQFAPGQYAGCPSLDYIGGVHYLTWLTNVGTAQAPYYVTKVARSLDDCFTFQYGGTLISPSKDELNNTSDVDFVEHDGKVKGIYLNGDQLTFAGTRTFLYPGTLAEMFAGAF